MTYSSANRGFPAGNPIANAIVIIVGTLAIAASIIIGFVAFLVLASIILVMAAVVGLRLWWFNRKLRREPRPDPDSGDGVIEGEFIVIAREEKDPR
ncbi:MAG: hypothetical protein QNJ05_10670 [Woeseiaceae bacterium]|nr:hypothetical protein [Woeseiaceae bacterium]